MTCRVNVMAPNGTITQARALLDCVALTSLITERLLQQLHFPRHPTNFTINGVAGFSVHPRGTVNFKIAGVRIGGKQIEMEASVLNPRLLLTCPQFPLLLLRIGNICRVWNWQSPTMELLHMWISCLEGKCLARQSSTAGGLVPPEHHQRFKRSFGWVLNGEVKGESRQSSSHVCCIALDDSSLRRFWEKENHNLQKPILSQEEKTVVGLFKKYHVRDKEGSFIVPLPQKTNVTLLRESRIQAIHRFKSMR